METANEPRAGATSTPADAPRLVAPLPDRPVDHSATFEQCLTQVRELIGVEYPPPRSDIDNRPARWKWQNLVRLT